MTPYLARVVRQDAHGSATEIFDQAEHHQPCTMTLVGWVMANDKAGVSVCCERWIEKGVAKFRGHTFVPRGIVTTVTRLR